MNDLDALLKEIRPHEEPSDAERAGARDGLTKRVGAGVFAASTAAEVSKAAAAGLAGYGVRAGSTAAFGLLWKRALIGLGALALTAGGAVYAVHTRVPVAPTTQLATSVPPEVGVVSAPPAVSATDPEPDVVPPGVAPAPASSAKAPSKVVRGPSSVPHGSQTGSIEEEIALIGEAQRALGAGDPARALQLADQHAARFPSGQLSEERAAVRVLAICALGRGDAKAQAERFLRERAASPAAGHVRKACGLP
jgi:hypothetical protein